MFLFLLFVFREDLMILSAVKGMSDLYGSRAIRWTKMEETIKKIVASSNFTEIRTPIVEELALFKRGVGESTDVVQKEMYDFLDKKGRHIAMRPEGTAGVARAFVEHGLGLNEPLPLKTFYIGPFFRYERPQKGRYRQFHQFGIEVFGDETPQIDAELIFTAMRVLTSFGIQAEVHVNSIGCQKCRADYREKLISYFSTKKEGLCEDCRNRLEINPLRLLDCKVCDPKTRCADIPKITECLCDDCREHFEQLQRSLTIFGVPFVVDPFIVRGLDYYTKTAFEITAITGGSQNAVAGGGRYDNLIHDIGGAQMPATGFAMGLERLFDLIPEDFFELPQVSVGYALSEDAVDQLVAFAKNMAGQPLNFFADYKPKKLKKALQKADRVAAAFTFIIGEDEAKEHLILVKNMKTGEQKTFAQNDIETILGFCR